MIVLKKTVCISVALILIVLTAALLIPHAVSEEQAVFANSDVEFYYDGLTYVVDTDDTGFLHSETSPGEDIIMITDYPVNTVAVTGSGIYISCGNSVKRILADGTAEEMCVSSDEIKYFSVCGDNVYFLSEGRICTQDGVVYEDGEIIKFNLESASVIAYMKDHNIIYKYDMLDGTLVSEENRRSDLGDDIPVVAPKDLGPEARVLLGDSIASLQSKFPAGKYWNHANNPGASHNNQNGYTSIPCPSHNGTIGTSSQTCNGFAPTGSQVSWQCMGYAEKCGYDFTGLNPRNSSNGWVTSYSTSALDSLKAGDIVRYRNNVHSIFITAVDGSTVTYTDCNSDGHCIIKWYRTVEKSTLRASFTFIRIAPWAGDSVRGHTDLAEYKVKFDGNGGSSNRSSMTVKDGEKIGELPVPTRGGYGFDGWFTEKEGGKIVNSDTVITKNMTLYAHWTINVYVITFDANGGSEAPAPIKKNHGESITITTEKATRMGYDFLSWNTKADGTGKKYKANESYSLNDSIVLYAQWDALPFMLRFDANGGTVAPGVNKTLDFDQKFGDLPVPEWAGHDFDGWFTLKEGGQMISPDHTFPLAQNLIVYAHWTPIVYQVTYDGNGYDGRKKVPATQDKPYGQSIHLEMYDLTMDGGTFVCWNTEPDGSGQTYRNNETYKKDAPLELYAVWNRQKFDVKYDANGGDSVPEAQVKEYGLSLKLSEKVPQRKGYGFDCWSTYADGKGVKYYPGDSYDINSEVTLYAQWVAGAYTVTFDAQGGTAEKKTAGYVYDSKYETLPSATRTGYVFDGWYTAADGGTRVTEDDIVKTEGNFTLYAHWTPYTYMVYFNAAQGECSETSLEVTYDQPYGTLPVPTRNGYLFAGWYTPDEKEIYSDSTVKITNNTTVTAKWVEGHYTAYFNPKGGICDTEYIMVQNGRSYGHLPEPTRKGFNFTGWYNGSESVDSGTTFTSGKDVVLEAHWTSIDKPATDEHTIHNVKWITDSGSQSQNYYKGQAIIVPDVKTSSDKKVFIGWDDEVPYTVYDKDLTFTAVYADRIAYAEFIADGECVGTVKYKAGATSVTPPEVPEKLGYSGKWESYTLSPAGTVIRAKYTMNTYTATFVADGRTVSVIPFTIETESITPPDIPLKSGYTAYWPEFTLTMSNIVINAKYEKITKYTHVSIGMGTGSISVKYLSTVHIVPRVVNPVPGSTFRWYVNDEFISEGDDFTKEKCSSDFDVRVEMWYEGSMICDSGNRRIDVNNSLYWRIIGFFRSLFNRLPTENIT